MKVVVHNFDEVNEVLETLPNRNAEKCDYTSFVSHPFSCKFNV